MGKLETTLDKDRKGRPFLLFSILFLFVAAACFFVFIHNGITLVRFHQSNIDSFSQRYIFAFQFRHFLENLFAGGSLNTWDWSIGLGADSLAFNMSNLFNPFSYITAFTPGRYMDIVYSLTIIARMYLSGICFILFARKIGIDDDRCVVGALIYTFSPWIMIGAMTQGHFLIATIMLPLVLLGEEKIMKGESPLVFILSVAYTVIVSFSFAYITAIIVFLYFFVRYFTFYAKQNDSAFWKTFGAFMASGVLGIMISGVSFIITFMRMSHSTSETSREIVNIYSLTRYLRTPLHMIDFTEIFGSNSVICQSALCIIMIPAILILIKKLNTNAIMALILFVFTEIPLMNRFFNFMSYETGRWMFALTFFFSLAAVEALDEEIVRRKDVRIVSLICVILYSGYLVWLGKVLRESRKNAAFAELASMIVIAVILYVIYVKKPEFLTWRRVLAAVTLVTVLGLAVSYTVIERADAKGFLKMGEAYRILNSSPQRAGALIDDDSFYRVDQVDECTGHRRPHCKVNEAMYFQNRSNYVFYSSVDKGWLEYNKLLGNNQGYFKRVAPNSNDQRFGIDILQGTRYFLGNSGKIKDANSYAGFGYEKYQKLDGVDVLKNRYSIGLGCAFTKYMRMAEWLKLNYIERELAMMEAVVIPDESEAPAGLSELKASDTDYDIRVIDYKKTGKKDDAFRLKGKMRDDEQIIVSIRNVRNDTDSRMKVVFHYGDLEKVGVKTENDERGFSDIDDVTVNLGRGSARKSVIRVVMRKMPNDNPDIKMLYDDPVIYGVPDSTYEKAAEAMMPGKFETDVTESDYIHGSVKCEKASVLYLSILDNNGWDIYVDGEKAKKLEEIDVAFTGVELSEGEHEIELKYSTPGLALGLLVSLLGIIGTVIFCILTAGSRSKRS